MTPKIVTTQNHIQLKQHTFSVKQSGQGEKIVLFHCSAANHSIWNPLVNLLDTEYQLIRPDLLGYGESSPFIKQQTDGTPDLDLAACLLSRSDAPVHVVGHSYGGILALMAAINHPDKVASLTLIEPVCFNQLRALPKQGFAHMLLELTSRIKSSLDHGDSLSAAKAFVSFWQSPRDWWFMSSDRQQKIAQAMPKVLNEFEGFKNISSISDTQFKNLSMPVHLVRGSHTKAIAHAMMDYLQEKLPHADNTTIAKAGHLLTITHPKPSARVLAKWLRKISKRQRCIQNLNHFMPSNSNLAMS